MKTKTPEQIFKQWQRIAKNATNRTNIDRAICASNICRRYTHAIFKANGMTDPSRQPAEKVNEIWHNAATPASIYTK